MTPLARRMLYVGYPVMIALNVLLAYLTQSDGWHRLREAQRFAPILLAVAGVGVLWLAFSVAKRRS